MAAAFLLDAVAGLDPQRGTAQERCSPDDPTCQRQRGLKLRGSSAPQYPAWTLSPVGLSPKAQDGMLKFAQVINGELIVDRDLLRATHQDLTRPKFTATAARLSSNLGRAQCLSVEHGFSKYGN